MKIVKTLLFLSQRKKLAKNKLKKFLQLEEYLHVKQPSLEELKQGYVLFACFQELILTNF